MVDCSSIQVAVVRRPGLRPTLLAVGGEFYLPETGIAMRGMAELDFKNGMW